MWLFSSTALAFLALVNVCFVLLTFARRRWQRHLRDIPGPILDSISYLSRLVKTAGGHRCLIDIDLHRQYGHVVRVGPNEVSFSDGAAISQVYSAYTKYEKSDFYLLFDGKTAHGPTPTLFSVRSEKQHRIMKRPVFGAYSMATMLELEPQVDECIEIFQRKLDQKLGSTSDTSIILNLGDWLHWYAMDVILSLSFSRCLNLMEQECDAGGVIAAIEGRLRYTATLGQAPFLHKLLLGNSVVNKLASFIPTIAKMNTTQRIMQFTAAQCKRYDNFQDNKSYTDLLDRYKRTNAEGVSLMSETDLLIAAASNVLAGSDTTAISLRALFFYLIKTPRCYRKLVEEIDEMDRQGKFSPIVGFSESNTMPYMQACLKEAMRLHPSVGLLLERIVPEEGITIAGKYIPPGTVIGANPWVVGRDFEVYGKDADEFRPERWLEAEQAEREGDSSRLRLMERNFLAFGTGSRTCLGKNVSLLEMNKLIPHFLRRYRFEFVDPDLELGIEDYWFVKQTGLVCRISQRNADH